MKGGDMISLGFYIRVLRATKELTQKQLAKLSGVSESTIVAIERDQRKPNDITLIKLNNVLTNGDQDILKKLFLYSNYKHNANK